MFIFFMFSYLFSQDLVKTDIPNYEFSKNYKLTCRDSSVLANIILSSDYDELKDLLDLFEKEDEKTKFLNTYIKDVNDGKISPLCLAIKVYKKERTNVSFKITKSLLNNGADPNMSCYGFDYDFPVQMAVRIAIGMKKYRLIKLLVKHDVVLNDFAVDNAISSRNKRLMRILNIN